MKKNAAILLCLLFFSLLSLSVIAEQPKGYWPYHVAYTEAVEKGNIDEILQKGDALLGFYAKFEMNKDIAANSFNVYYYRYQNSVFEKRGDYAAALDNLEKLRKVSEIAGIADMDIVTDAKARKIKTRASVYALTDNANPVWYGAPYEPTHGVLYGRALSAPQNQLQNPSKIADESVCSLYLNVGQNTADEFLWLLEKIDFSNKALHIAYNFPKEGQTAREILAGYHDGNIRQTLATLAKWEGPVFLRIGAEMNVWTTPSTPEDYIAAYRRIASLARQFAPNLALVFSPNFVGAYGDRMKNWYPGDDVVDYVGVSLYCNSYFYRDTCENPDEFGCLYFSAGDFADPILAVAEAAETFGKQKPILVTESGAAHFYRSKGVDDSDFAARQIERLYRLLPMVYPQIKSIIYFDIDLDGASALYNLEDNPKVEAAYAKAVASSPALLHGVNEKAKSYVRLQDFCEATDTVFLSAYANAPYSDAVTVTYALDGNQLGQGTDITYAYTLCASDISVGAHTFTATFSDGKNYTEVKTYSLSKNDYGVLRFSETDLSGGALSPSAWAKEEIADALAYSLVPDRILCAFTDKITREEFCMLIMQMLRTFAAKSGVNLDALLIRPVDHAAFSDTNNNDVLYASALGILNGRGGGIFDPDSFINREEAATMLANTAKLMGIEKGTAVTFADADLISGWAKSSVEMVSSIFYAAKGRAVMSGVGGNRFDPKGSYTREQAILTAVRLFCAK